MMEVVTPLAVKAVPAFFTGVQHLGVIEIAFGDDWDRTAETFGKRAHFRLKLCEEGVRAEVEDPMDSVETQRVDVKVLGPIERIIDEVAAHRVAIGAVEVDRFSPRRLVSRAEIGTVGAEIIPFRA